MADAYACVLFGYVCLGGDPLSSSVMIGMSCIWVFLFCFVSFTTGSLCSPSCSETCCIDQAGLKLIHGF